MAGDCKECEALRKRAEEAELGCDVLAVGEPYERLASTLEAGKVALRERDAASARASELAMVVHALMRRLGTDDVGLRPEELRQAAADCMLRDLYVVADPGRGFLEGARQGVQAIAATLPAHQLCEHRPDEGRTYRRLVRW